MPYSEILYATEGPIGFLTLNNPSKINALLQNMIAELSEARVGAGPPGGRRQPPGRGNRGVSRQKDAGVEKPVTALPVIS